jgi:hypothetical protein
MSFDAEVCERSLAGMSVFDRPIRGCGARQRRFRYIGASWLAMLVSCAAAFAETDRIFVSAKINGISMRFGFDTGAGFETCIWRDVSDGLGIKATRPAASMQLAAGQIGAGLSEPLTLELNGATFPDTRIVVVDGPPFAKWETQGIVGWPSMRKAMWLIDQAHGRVDSLAELPDVSGWVRYPIVQEATSLLIRVPADEQGKLGIVAIDTGSPGGVALAPALWAKWRGRHPTAQLTYQSNVMLATGYTALEATAAEEWSIDRLVMKDVLLEQANATDLALCGPDYLATLGLGALRQFIVILDGKNGYAYFRPSGVSPSLGDYNRMGVVLLPTDAKATAWSARVLPGSPGWSAGIRDGDMIVAFNRLAVDHWRQRPGTWPPQVVLQPAGTPVEMTVNRSGRRVAVPVVLQDILQPKAAPVPARPPPPELPAFHFLPPFANVIRKADALNLPLRNPAVSSNAAPALHKDDKVTALVTVVDDERIQQWLVLFVNTELKPSEREPGKPAHVYSSSGRDLIFERLPAGVAVRALGPFEQTDKRSGIEDKWSGAILDGRSLTLGFDSVATMLVKASAAPGVGFGFRATPFPANETMENRKRLEAAGIGVDDERAFVGGAGALGEFFRIASQTPGVRDVLRELLDLSWKDYLRNPNIDIDFMGVDNASSEWWGLPPGIPCPTLTFRIMLNGVPRIVCRVAATRPVRPLQTVAGIVGVAAGRVDGSGPHVMVRLLGASAAGSD